MYKSGDFIFDEDFEEFIKHAKNTDLDTLIDTDAMEYIAEDIIYKIKTNSNMSTASINYIDAILDYVSLLMDKDPNAITNFGFISHLYQLAQTEEGEAKGLKKIKTFFANRIQKDESDIKMFDKYTDEDYYKKYSVLFNDYIKNNIESLVNTK